MLGWSDLRDVFQICSNDILNDSLSSQLVATETLQSMPGKLSWILPFLLLKSTEIHWFHFFFLHFWLVNPLVPFRSSGPFRSPPCGRAQRGRALGRGNAAAQRCRGGGGRRAGAAGRCGVRWGGSATDTKETRTGKESLGISFLWFFSTWLNVKWWKLKGHGSEHFCSTSGICEILGTGVGIVGE